jgi:hypothetical protein
MYTRDRLKMEIAKIYAHEDRQFIWAQSADDAFKSARAAGQSPGQAAAAAAQKKSTMLDELVDYCWVAYHKAQTATGPQVIGRIKDLHETLQAKIANILPKQTLFDESTRGNVLRLDKWCVVANDCWLLGGIHRAATFHLMSGLTTWTNTWDSGIGGFVVTVREMLGLQEFGYEPERGTSLGAGSPVVTTFVCRYPALADAADLESYQLAVALKESRGVMGAVSVMNSMIPHSSPPPQRY